MEHFILLARVIGRSSGAPNENIVQNRFNIALLIVENAISKKPPLLIAQNTPHKLGVAFEVRERKN